MPYAVGFRRWTGWLAWAGLAAGGCSPGSLPAPPQAGQTIPMSLKLDGQSVWEATYQVYDLEQPGGPQAGTSATLFALLQQQTYDPSFLAGQEPGVQLPTLTLADAQAFLADTWDGYVNGTDDVGVDAAALSGTLEQHQIDLGSFIQLATQSGLAFPDFMAFANGLLTTGSTLDDFDQVLDALGLTSGAFFGSLADAGLSPQQFVAALAARGDDLDSFYADYMAADQVVDTDDASATSADPPLALADFLPAYLAGTTPAAKAGPKDAGKLIVTGLKAAKGLLDIPNTIVDATKMIWDIVKSSRPVVGVKGVSAYALSGKDPDPLNYAGVKSNQTRELTLNVGSANIKFRVQADYAAEHPDYPGTFIAGANCNPEATAGGFTQVDVQAKVTNVVNTGGWGRPGSRFPDPPNPRFYVVVVPTVSNLAHAQATSITIQVTGKDGVQSDLADTTPPAGPIPK